MGQNRRFCKSNARKSHYRHTIFIQFSGDRYFPIRNNFLCLSSFKYTHYPATQTKVDKSTNLWDWKVIRHVLLLVKEAFVSRGLTHACNSHITYFTPRPEPATSTLCIKQPVLLFPKVGCSLQVLRVISQCGQES